MKIVMEVLKLHLPKENVLIVQDLWRAHNLDNFVEGIQKSKLKDCDCFLQYERAT